LVLFAEQHDDIKTGIIGMLAQIGRMLYWLGSILAAIILASDLMVACDEEPHAPYSGFILMGYAFIAWLIGWICRRILSNAPTAKP
jgi:hypothetical protein